jgi:hypothetical protein
MRRLVALVILVALPTVSAAEEYYFVTVFGGQRRFKQPEHSHSWAVFVRLCGEGCDLSKYKMEYFTVSWLPATLEVRTYAVRPEEGVNLELHTTFQWALDDRQIVAYWGPYQITPDFYARAYQGAGLLNSGAVRYKAIDTGYDTSQVSNCIHACSDLADGQPRLRIASPGWGHSASYAITARYRDGIVDYDTTYEWILDCLGLSGYEMEARDFRRGNPTIGPLLRTMQNINRFSFR